MSVIEQAMWKPQSTAETLLEVRGLTTHLGSASTPVRAVDYVSFAIRAGETFVLLGESGCGKSMIALSIMRLLPKKLARIAAGRVLFDGTDLAALDEVLHGAAAKKNGT